ncbi:hypothetical protein OS493_005213 [Desmophyllum pertusum]|uniref:Apple domain-containing protein n=1 Tax=Desmophyllum pertusum TaxID=174260 RepID=A0A9W9Z4N5_9CNID|nr:hypothetical protein OS493_005213 [Desmophyllum pertusum]
MACALECRRRSSCFSFNFAVYQQSNGCELLREDKYTSSDRFEPSQFYHHYSMASPCEYSPCKNGATCRPLYGSDGFICERSPGSIEQGAPWIKLNKNEVCFGAKDDSYGNFTMTSTGNILTLKLVYISGFVTCNNKTWPYGSHWACRKGSSIATLVTNAVNRVIFPHDYQNMTYLLPGYHDNSSELIFKLLSPPLRVAAGDEYRIWYNEDLVNGLEVDNDGHTCVDVYALYI